MCDCEHVCVQCVYGVCVIVYSVCTVCVWCLCDCVRVCEYSVSVVYV